MLLADLHSHSLHSDGMLSPGDLVRLASKVGLNTLALTDHDTTSGLAEAVRVGKESNIDVVPGVELSVRMERQEVHLLGYLFDPEEPRLCAFLQQSREDRLARAERMVKGLNGAGIPLTMEDVLAQSPGQAIGRPHVAGALLARSLVSSFEDAFNLYLTPGKPGFAPKRLLPIESAIDLLHGAGGMAVIAHPGGWISEADIARLAERGLDGIEAVHPSHDAEMTRYHEHLAKVYGLVATGGSDYHGHRERDRTSFGVYMAPATALPRLRQLSAGRSAQPS